MTTERRRLVGDQGQVAPMVVILVVAILALGGLVLDGGRILATRREANSLASSAARAGAQSVDLNAARADQSRLDPVEAESKARQFLQASGNDGTIIVSADQVEVTITMTAHPVLLSLVGMGDRPVTGHGTARIVRGQ